MASGKLFRAVTVVTMFSVITRALSFLFKIYLSRTLGAEVMGLYQIALSMFFLFSALSASGLQTVLSRKTAELRKAHPEATLQELAELEDPPLTKSAINHRMRKLIELSKT